MSESKQSNFNTATSLFAIGISVIAMVVSLVEVSAMRSQQRAEVWPYIAVSTTYNNEGFFLRLENKGVGPALMHDVALLYDGQPITDLDQLILDTVGPEDAFSYDLYRTADASDMVLSPGDVVTLFGVPWEPRTRRFTKALGDGFDVSACYCSIHEECWQTALSQVRAEAAPRCD